MESRMEAYLNAAISGNTENLPQPISRIDFLLCELIKTLGESGASIEEVEKIVTDKVAEIVADAPEDFNTLKEISDWIYTHEDSAAAMNTAIQKNANSIENLTTEIINKADSANVYDKATADSRFLGIDATADKAVADENGSNISETFSTMKNDIVLNRTTLGTQCKNLLKPTSSKTRAGITYTVNQDGSVALTGTSTTGSSYNYFSIPVTLQPGKYKVNGMPETSSNTTYRVDLRANESGGTAYGYGAKEFEVEFAETTTVYYMIRIDGSYKEELNGITFYPMIRYADITDDTYEPYKENVDERLIKNKSNTAINKSTLGTQCKNLLKNTAVTKTVNGVTFTVNSDGSITAKQTTAAPGNATITVATITLKPGTYILTGDDEIKKSGFGEIRFYVGSTVYSANTAHTFDTEVTIIVKIFVWQGVNINGSKTIYPMLRYADITDSTYEPYKESVDERLIKNKSDIAVNKSTLGYQRKNLLKNTAVTTTINGVTFTVNDDKSITVNGTATSAGVYAVIGGADVIAGNRYIISGGAGNGGTYGLYTENFGTVQNYGSDSIYVPNTTGKAVFRIFVRPGVTVSNVIFYPMIRYADITDSTYEAYKDSVDERITNLEARIAALEV